MYKVPLSTNFTIENEIFYGVSLGNLANESAFMLQQKLPANGEKTVKQDVN